MIPASELTPEKIKTRPKAESPVQVTDITLRDGEVWLLGHGGLGRSPLRCPPPLPGRGPLGKAADPQEAHAQDQVHDAAAGAEPGRLSQLRRRRGQGIRSPGG